MSGLLPVPPVLPVLPLKAQPAIAGPGAVSHAEPVSNDIRMPSRAALQQQLDVGLFAGAARGPASPGAATAVASESVTLSPAARALSVILDATASSVSKIIGTQALWPLRQPPMAQLLAATLAHTVDNSGLFYESHLQQFAAGTRTLEQVAQEPQARLAAVVGPAAMPANLPGMAPEIVPAVTAEMTASLKAEGEAVPVQDAQGPESSAKPLTPNALDAAHSNALIPAGVHADAVALVRQQLELLAQPVFRWSGEAWPGTPMDWEIHREPEDRSAGSDAPPRNWSTRLAVSLPELKDVEVRLSLVGNTLQLQLAASDNATVALLGNGRHELPARFAALGLQLRGVWVGGLAPEPGAPVSANDGATAWPG